jgi:hypothetical protein
MSSQPTPTRQLTLAPHQTSLVDEIVAAGARGRYLLLAPPGTGKAVALAAVLGKIHSKLRGGGRFLVVAPAPYVERWRLVVERWAGIRAEIVDARSYLRSRGAGAGPLRAPGCYVVSVDFVKNSPYLDELRAADWDALVLDEVEALRGRTVRAEAAELLWNSKQIPLGLASAGAEAPAWFFGSGNLVQTSWRDIATAYRATVSRPDVVAFEFSRTERRFFDDLLRLLHRFNPEKRRGFAFGPVVQEMAASSIYAIELVLRSTVDDTARAFDRWTPDNAADSEAARSDFAAVRRGCTRVLGLLEAVETDSKWEACAGLIAQAMSANAGSAVIYTEFEATAGYVATLCEAQGWPVRLLSAQPDVGDFEANFAYWEAIAFETAPTVIVAPAPITDFVDLERMWGAIHYDLPSDPGGLLRRLPVVQAGSTHMHQFVLADGLLTTAERVGATWGLAGRNRAGV